MKTIDDIFMEQSPGICAKCNRKLRFSNWLQKQEDGSWNLFIPADLIHSAVANEHKIAEAKKAGISIQLTSEELNPNMQIRNMMQSAPYKCPKCNALVCGECANLKYFDRCFSCDSKLIGMFPVD